MTSTRTKQVCLSKKLATVRHGKDRQQKPVWFHAVETLHSWSDYIELMQFFGMPTNQNATVSIYSQSIGKPLAKLKIAARSQTKNFWDFDKVYESFFDLLKHDF